MFSVVIIVWVINSTAASVMEGKLMTARDAVSVWPDPAGATKGQSILYCLNLSLLQPKRMLDSMIY